MSARPNQLPPETPRERQVRLETARVDLCLQIGHMYVEGNDRCVNCEEPYPVIVVDPVPTRTAVGDVVRYGSGTLAHHVEAWNGDYLAGQHGATRP